MQAAATFAETLESVLNCTPVPRASSAWSRPLTTPLFVFDLPRPVVARGSVDRVMHTQPPAGAPTPFAAPRATRTVTLSAREMRALAALNALGAGLDESLSRRTLRHAFRRLARRYHPDRHPGSRAAEQERLARLFAEATAHYRVLAAAMNPA